MTDLLQDAAVREALDRYGEWCKDIADSGRSKDTGAEAALVAAVVSAYQASLVAQTDAETMETAVQVAFRNLNETLMLLDRDYRLIIQAAAPILLASANARIAELKAMLQSAERGGQAAVREGDDLRAKLAEAEKRAERLKQERVAYQDVVYAVCAWAERHGAPKYTQADREGVVAALDAAFDSALRFARGLDAADFARQLAAVSQERDALKATVRRETLEEIQAMVDKIHTRRAGDLNHEWSEYKDGAYDAAGEILDEITRVADAATRAGGDQ